MVEVFVGAEDVEGAILLRVVLPAIDDGERAPPNPGTRIKNENVPLGGFHLNAGGIAGVVGEGDRDAALDTPEGDAEAGHMKMSGEARDSDERG